MPQSKNFLMSSTAARQRLSRLGGSVKEGAMVVHAETAPCWEVKSMIEFDANDINHAHEIAEAWVTKHNAKSCGFHYVDPDGSLGRCSGVTDESDYS